ncbi:hypothetical protein J6590_011083 [Homalodisca vitripennis]|nr:hypothetical protein J6590_011083 [Homalodisca vitripennis]
MSRISQPLPSAVHDRVVSCIEEGMVMGSKARSSQVGPPVDKSEPTTGRGGGEGYKNVQSAPEAARRVVASPTGPWRLGFLQLLFRISPFHHP